SIRSRSNIVCPTPKPRTKACTSSSRRRFLRRARPSSSSCTARRLRIALKRASSIRESCSRLPTTSRSIDRKGPPGRYVRLLHAVVARGGVLAAGGAGELRPLRVLAERTRPVCVGVAVHRRETGWRLSVLDPVAKDAQAVEFRVEDTEAVAEARNHVEP